ncbi:tripartite ATP-independent transporter DctM subunit [Rhodovulum imhoffii]|uniref:Tripartite ATP-independent transporter DctM subunit n=1 Tax=Rhodovulum imhoffii TaxID=365340 RepID=A0A2T5BTM7_9RHOB|nr:TRAP transporter large permease [Rhodovulum imhoffii]MBK5934144.1 C4-dicarboxylate ABC transporter permease [Rhodovulum imhoffii]PTN02782.1 tripartite ATP-independent transporter DctM subunit [Rhodovulum imhoffii]
MSGPETALYGFAALLALIFLRVPIGAAMALTGFCGTWIVLGSPAAMLGQLKSLSYDSFASYSLSIVPLFLLMGQFATRSGLSAALFAAASDWLGHRRGGVAMAAIGACAGFGAVSGSSLATASTMGQVALPEMRKRGYSPALATGTLAAGGTLGILIPPSVILVIYAILTQQNVVKMFLAALIPGLVATLGYMGVIAIYVRVWPDAAGAGMRLPLHTRLRSLRAVWPVAAIFVLVIGGIVADWNWFRPGVQALFTPTEGAAVGAVATGLYALATGRLTRAALSGALLATASGTAMVFFILLGAQIFGAFVAYTQAPQALSAWVAGLGLPPMAVLLALLLFYLVLGCVMDSLSMILLTIPVFFPLIQSLDFGLSPEAVAVWFGILALMVVEIGLITPPVGMNLFVINGMSRDIDVTKTYAGVFPFVLSDILRVGLIVALPGMALWLPGL